MSLIACTEWRRWRHQVGMNTLFSAAVPWLLSMFLNGPAQAPASAQDGCYCCPIECCEICPPGCCEESCCIECPCPCCATAAPAKASCCGSAPVASASGSCCGR